MEHPLLRIKQKTRPYDIKQFKDKVVTDAIYIDLESNKFVKTTVVATSLKDKNESTVVFYYIKDLNKSNHPKRYSLKIEDFKGRFTFQGFISEVMDAKVSEQVKEGLLDIMDEYIGEEFNKDENERNDDLLDMAYEISMLMNEWIED